MFGGAGNDTLVWNPGDANDLVEGQAGRRHDGVQRRRRQPRPSKPRPSAGRLRFTRNLGNIVMDVGGHGDGSICRALGGADTAAVNDLTGTDVTKVDIDLAVAIGGGAGDAAADTITVNGTDGPDNVAVAANAGVVDVTGLFTPGGRTRTCNPRFWRPVLCQLSYAPRVARPIVAAAPYSLRVAPPPPRTSLGALFFVLAIVFAGIAAAAAEAVGDEPGLVVVVVAAAAIGLWLFTLSVRNLRKPRP